MPAILTIKVTKKEGSFETDIQILTSPDAKEEEIGVCHTFRLVCTQILEGAEKRAHQQQQTNHKSITL